MQFPYTNLPHGPYSTTHSGVWELYPAIDHYIPIKHYDKSITIDVNEIENLLTVSSVLNMHKGNFHPSMLNLKPIPLYDLEEWDGLEFFFKQYLSTHKELLLAEGCGKRFKKWIKHL